ncbi:MAG: hypothetical protein WDM81_14370 [Rhizomicrobium sp.]
MTQLEDTGRLLDPHVAAGSAGLRYVSGGADGIARHRAGNGFFYTAADGTRLRDKAALARIRALAIPPAWKEVWICPQANGHIQATGIDAKGRKQYRYNDEFRRLRESAKFEHILVFAQVLPAIRGTVARDMARPGLPREKVLATVVHLLETTLVRVGNKDYARTNGSYGLTTLKIRMSRSRAAPCVFISRARAARSGSSRSRTAASRTSCAPARTCRASSSFNISTPTASGRGVDSSDVNAYLKDITGRDISAKDFRTWFGTVAAALALHERGACDSEAEAKKTAREIIEEVAGRLGNTPTICRKCYIHPAVLEAFGDGALALRIRRSAKPHALTGDEAAVYRFLLGRLN